MTVEVIQDEQVWKMLFSGFSVVCIFSRFYDFMNVQFCLFKRTFIKSVRPQIWYGIPGITLFGDSLTFLFSKKFSKFFKGLSRKVFLESVKSSSHIVILFGCESLDIKIIHVNDARVLVSAFSCNLKKRALKFAIKYVVL